MCGLLDKPAPIAAMTEADEVVQRLDEVAFPRFQPLLSASQDYAEHSGCRFRSNSFSGLGDIDPSTGMAVVGTERSLDSGPRLSAKLRAAPTVSDFAGRLLAGEPALVEELDRAFRIVMVETVRNAMRGLFKQLDMFPPPSPPAHISDDDCSYEDMAEPLPVIAQRLYNDEVRRLENVTGIYPRLERRALTACFIVDFAEVQGKELPPMPETLQMMLREFAQRTEEYTKEAPAAEKGTSSIREAFLQALGPGSVADQIRQDAQKFWGENRRSILAVAAGVAAGGLLMGGAALAAALSTRNREQEDEHEQHSTSSRRNRASPDNR